MKIYGLFIDLSYHSSDANDSMEVFKSIADAKKQLFARYMSNGLCYCYVNCLSDSNKSGYYLFPCVTTEAKIILFSEPHSDCVLGEINFGPRGGVRYIKNYLHTER